MTTNAHEETIKCHDDHIPVRLDITETVTDSADKFKLVEGSSRFCASVDQSFGLEKLRSGIDPWLTARVQSEHLSLLIGSGLPHVRSTAWQHTRHCPA